MFINATQLRSLLAEISEIRVMPDAAGVLVHVPAIDRSILINPDAVRQHNYVTGPTGKRALQLLLDLESVPVQAIVASNDLVFAPDTRDAGLGIKVSVTDAPPLVSVSEMMRDLDTVAQNLSTEKNFDNVVGALVMLRYFVAGAKRVGIECSDAESKLRQLWDGAGVVSAAKE
jgi:hypothetical protein